MQSIAVGFVPLATSSLSYETVLLLFGVMWNTEISCLVCSRSTLAWRCTEQLRAKCHRHSPNLSRTLLQPESWQLGIFTGTVRCKFQSARSNSNVNVFSPHFPIIDNYPWKINELGITFPSPCYSVLKLLLHCLSVFCSVFSYSSNCCLATQITVQNMSSQRLLSSIKF